MRSKSRTGLILFIFTLLILDFTRTVLGSNLGIAQELVIDEDDVKTGNIITVTDGVYKLTTTEYDQNIVGVVDIFPPLSLNLTDNSKPTYPVIGSGQVYVLVNDSNGSVKKGDLITSSATPGVGMRASHRGAVIGQALEDVNPSDNMVLIAINIHYNELSGDQDEGGKSTLEKFKDTLIGILSFEKTSDFQEPSELIKFMLSSIVLLVSVIFAFLNFAKVARTGVEAIGRNPLAGKMIALGIALNVIITLFILLAGFLLAYYIVTL